MLLFPHCDHRDGRVPVHVYLPTQAHALAYLHTRAYRHTRACPLPAQTHGHASARTHSQMQYSFLIFMVKISHFSRQGALRSLRPPNSPQHKPRTDRAVILCFQKWTTKIREEMALTYGCLCNALLTESHQPLGTTAVCSSPLKLLHPSSLWSIRASGWLKAASGCIPQGCQRFESDTSWHCHNPVLHSHEILLLSERNQIPAAKERGRNICLRSYKHWYACSRSGIPNPVNASWIRPAFLKFSVLPQSFPC